MEEKMKKKIIREIEVEICDYCGREITYYNKCVSCGRTGCTSSWMKETDHWEYSIEIYRYRDGNKLIGHICKECKDVVKVLDGLKWK
jgi:hypothetical protein